MYFIEKGAEKIFKTKESVPIRENEEKLVPLSGISKKIKVYPYYFTQHLPGAVNDCYLRESAANLLLQASKLLPKDHHFVVFDAWRPYKLQLSLYKNIEEEFQTKGITGSELKRKISTFVDKPSEDPSKPANHLTGGAIDLTIATNRGLLNMGTNFDEFTEKSRTDFYENLVNLNNEERLIRENRRYLKGLMEKVGFSNYEEEWWHYDYGNQNWGKTTGNPAFYGGIISLEGHVKG